MAAFCEANVLWTTDTKLLHSKVEAAVRLGFDTVIINNSVSGDALKGRKEKGKNQKAVTITKSSEVRLSNEYIESLSKKYGRSIQQYTRLTTVVADPGQTHKLQSDKIIQAYDILAVAPTSEKTFQLACMTLDVDLITFDFTQKMPFHFKRTNITVAIERGLHFEVTYSTAIRDQTARRNTITNSLYLNRITKGKNILLSGACEKDIELRGPYDVANLGLLFGLTEAQAKDAVSTNARALFMHAKSRRVSGTVLSVTAVGDLSSGDAWKVRGTASATTQLDDASTGDEDDDEDEDEKGPPPAKRNK